jgi:hypothetical protein
MRVVALLLLMANLVYFAWQYPQHQLLKNRQLSEVIAAQAVSDGEVPAQSLMMLKELPQAVAEKVVTINVGKAVPPSAGRSEAASSPVCWTVGPFDDGREADRGLTLLTARGIKGRTQQRKGRMLAGYRVQLPGQGSKAAAQRTLLALRGRGVRDVAILEDKGLYYISLGFFSKPASADTRSAEVRKLGYKSLIEKVYRERSAYWLDLYPVTDKVGLDEAWEQLTSTYPEIERQTLNCSNKP